MHGAHDHRSEVRAEVEAADGHGHQPFGERHQSEAVTTEGHEEGDTAEEEEIAQGARPLAGGWRDHLGQRRAAPGVHQLPRPGEGEERQTRRDREEGADDELSEPE